MKAWLIAALLAASVAPTMAAPLTDVAAVPYLSAKARRSYALFLGVNLPRAVAIAANGAIGWAGGSWAKPDEVRREALANCRKDGGEACALYGVGLDTVWPGAEYAPSKPPGPLLSTWDYSFVPDARYVWLPPQQARGVFVWSNGKSSDLDLRGVQPSPWVRAFNLAGFDVVRLDRDPIDDQDPDRVARWLAGGLALMRRLGFHTVVAGGQSFGAWNSLQMLDHPGIADAIVAVSPAAQGTAGGGNLFSQDDDLRRIFSGLTPTGTRLAVVQFREDLFLADAAARGRMLGGISPRIGALLLIDRPTEFAGHMAGEETAFEERYGACLVRFVTAAAPPQACS